MTGSNPRPVAYERYVLSYPLDRKLAVEFIGMFLFVFTVGMATESANRSGAVLAPIAIGSVLMVIVFAGGHVSGGHYNPAVSTAVFIRGKIKAHEYGAYVVTQFVAAVLAGLLVTAVGAFNPAIALGASVLGAFRWSHIWIYLLADFTGGAAAAGAFLYIQGEHAKAE